MRGLLMAFGVLAVPVVGLIVFGIRKCYTKNRDRNDELDEEDNDHALPVENVLYQAASDIGLQNPNHHQNNDIQ